MSTKLSLLSLKEENIRCKNDCVLSSTTLPHEFSFAVTTQSVWAEPIFLLANARRLVFAAFRSATD